MPAAARKEVTPARKLEFELEAAKTLKEQLRDILGNSQDLDAQTLKDTIEGETNLLEVVEAVVKQVGEDEARVEGIKEYSRALSARCTRLTNRADTLRSMLTNVLDLLGEKKLELPIATVTLKAVAPKLNVYDEPAVPSQFWRIPEPVLAKKDLTEALKARKAALDEIAKRLEANEIDADMAPHLRAVAEAQFPEIPGAELDNGSVTTQIRFS
jgi:DNA repair exonuclease SbcCD ATPase subunit